MYTQKINISASTLQQIKDLPYQQSAHLCEADFIKIGYAKQSLTVNQQFGSREAESLNFDWEWTKQFHPEHWQDVGLMFDKAGPGYVIPEHTDHFKYYVDHFGHERQNVRRMIVFLEDWKSGHYFQLKDKPFVQWQQGDCVEWGCEDTHLGGNLGKDTRYTLQITGVPIE